MSRLEANENDVVRDCAAVDIREDDFAELWCEVEQSRRTSFGGYHGVLWSVVLCVCCDQQGQYRATEHVRSRLQELLVLADVRSCGKVSPMS
jgi:hypothetical protein